MSNKEIATTTENNEKKYVKSGAKYKIYSFFKRAIDLIFSTIVIVCFSWLYLIIALAVKISDGGPVFYLHKRLGKNGKEIVVPKFRSMKVNADKVEKTLNKEQLKNYKQEYKVNDDPRITKLGAFLRKTSLDELPNVFAIFIGTLSIVGPRPIMKEEAISAYGKDMDKLLSVKPGMVGWWAVNGRNNRTYKTGERQALELYYVDHCSLWLDLKIFFKAIVCVFKKDGAQ